MEGALWSVTPGTPFFKPKRRFSLSFMLALFLLNEKMSAVLYVTTCLIGGSLSLSLPKGPSFSPNENCVDGAQMCNTNTTIFQREWGLEHISVGTKS